MPKRKYYKVTTPSLPVGHLLLTDKEVRNLIQRTANRKRRKERKRKRKRAKK